MSIIVHSTQEYIQNSVTDGVAVEYIESKILIADIAGHDGFLLAVDFGLGYHHTAHSWLCATAGAGLWRRCYHFWHGTGPGCA